MAQNENRIVWQNKKYWEELSKTLRKSDYYNFQKLQKGKPCLSEIEQEELGDLTDLSGVHLQCGFGIETVSLALLGAKVVGVDFSLPAVLTAKKVSSVAAKPPTFIVANVCQRFAKAETFEFAYTSSGVLRWLPSLEDWASQIASILVPGGWFYLFEIHPLVYRLQGINEKQFTLSGNYFEESPVKKKATTHAYDQQTTFENAIHVDWTMQSILCALLEAGLTLDFYHEHNVCVYARKGMLSRKEDGLFHPPIGSQTPIPLTFSVRFFKPIR